MDGGGKVDRLLVVTFLNIYDGKKKKLLRGFLEASENGSSSLQCFSGEQPLVLNSCIKSPLSLYQFIYLILGLGFTLKLVTVDLPLYIPDVQQTVEGLRLTH